MNARDEIVDFLVDQIPTNALAGFQPSTEARERIWELIAREKDAGLLPERWHWSGRSTLFPHSKPLVPNRKT